MIKVSVIVPVYKVPLKYLRACLDSLTAQTMQECEFIVVSDGAPEAECAICEEYTKKDSRFKFFKREHAGVSAIRNYSIGLASGEYITFVDADDVIDCRALDEWHYSASQWDSEILITNYANIPINGQPFQERHWKTDSKERISSFDTEDILEEFIRRKANSIPRGVCGKLYQRKFLLNNSILFNPLLKIGEDFVFNFICFSKATKISYFHDIFYLCHQNTKSVTRVFDYEFFHNRFAPLLEIKNSFSSKYHPLLGREALDLFFQSWERCYMSPQNQLSFHTRTRNLVQIIKSNAFQTIISNINTHDLGVFMRIELFFIQRQCTILIKLHCLKSYMLSKI